MLRLSFTTRARESFATNKELEEHLLKRFKEEMAVRMRHKSKQSFILLDITQDDKNIPQAITFESLKKECEKGAIEVAEVLFVFPDYDSHPAKENTLYSLRKGRGFAKVARELGKQKVATLSLPTTFRQKEYKHSPEKQMALAEKAMADVCRAVGYGFHIALPVRKRGSSVKMKDGRGEPICYPADYFFTEALSDDLEPSFWGSIELDPNPALAAYYLTKLTELKSFFEAIHTEQAFVFSDKAMEKAYEEGRAEKSKKNPSPWFLPPSRSHSQPIPISRHSKKALHSRGVTMFTASKQAGELHKNVPFRGHVIEVYEEHITGDGHCGFGVFATEKQSIQEVRNKVCATLLKLSSDESVRAELSEEISNALGGDDSYVRLSSKLEEEWKKLKDHCMGVIEREGEIRLSVLKLFFKNAGKLEMSSVELITYLKNKNLLDEANELEQVLQAQAEGQHALQTFCQRQDVYEEYVKCYQGKAWLGCKSAKRYAAEEGLSFYLWEKQPLKEGKFKWVLREDDCYEAEKPVDVVCAVYQQGIHFNRLHPKHPLPLEPISASHTKSAASSDDAQFEDIPLLESDDESSSDFSSNQDEDDVKAPPRVREPFDPLFHQYTQKEYDSFMSKAPPQLKVLRI